MNEKTASICPVCRKTLPARRILKSDGIYLVRSCPEHGEFETLIWLNSDVQALQWDKWTLENADQMLAVREGTCPHHCDTCQDHQQQACCVLIEVTERCNQHCAFCFATSKEGQGQDLGLTELEGIYDNLLTRTGSRPYNIQLSGGEPTLNQDLAKMIRMGKDKGFPYIQLKRLVYHQSFCSSMGQRMRFIKRFVVRSCLQKNKEPLTNAEKLTWEWFWW
ncbi:MAG: 7,8-dihydro-6-hydroxymethylpterin dimethyltransferase [Eubacteriaceae bacterium]|nr:7,8-dihydro-6-hydroxymethylpterin dimethyltransferase [Eubacteriaceae bacterium]